MNNIEFYKNLVQIMAAGTAASNTKHVNNTAITPQPFGAAYTEIRPNEDKAAENYNKSSSETNDSEGGKTTANNEDTRETPDFYYNALKNGLAETVKNNNKELLPQIELLADEYMEYFCNNSMDTNGEALPENMIAIINNLITGSLTSYTADYVKTHKDETLKTETVAKDFKDFIEAKLKEFSDKQVAAGEFIDGLKNPDGKSFEDLSNVIKTAQENNYISNSETKEIKAQTAKYIVQGLMNDDAAVIELLKAIKPAYETNTNYTRALTSLKSAKRYEDACDYVNAQTSYKDVQDKIAALLSTVGVGEITKAVKAAEEAKIPPEPTPDPDKPAAPLDNIKNYTDKISQIASDAAKAYEVTETGEDTAKIANKKAAKVLLDSINKYKDAALEAAKNAENAKTDEEKAALNKTLTGYQGLIEGFVKDFDKLLGIETVTSEDNVLEPWTRESASASITKAYEDAKKVYDTMKDGAVKTAAKTYLDNIETAKNQALELLKSEPGDKFAERALQEKSNNFLNFINDMSSQINTLNGTPATEPGGNGGGSSVDVVSPAQLAKQEMNRAEVLAVINDCNNLIASYNSLPADQQVSLKTAYDTATAVLSTYQKYSDNSLKTTDEVKNNTKAITDKAAEIKTSAQIAKSLADQNAASQTKAIKDACQAALNDSSVQAAIYAANNFLTSYSELTTAQQNQFMDSAQFNKLKDAYDKATQILADQAKLQNNTPASANEVSTIKNNITNNAKNLASAKQTADEIVAEIKTAAAQAAVKEASDEALKDSKVTNSYNTATKFMEVYNTLPKSAQDELSNEYQEAQNVIDSYNKLKNYEAKYESVVSSLKTTLTRAESKMTTALNAANAKADNIKNMAKELQSLNSDPVVTKAMSDITKFTTEYNKLTDEQKKDPKIAAAYKTVQESASAFVEKMTSGKFNSAEDVKKIHSLIQNNATKISKALEDLNSAIKELNKPAPEPGQPDPAVKKAIDGAKPVLEKVYQPIRANIKSFIEYYEKLDDNAKNYPEVKKMNEYVQKIQTELTKFDTYDYKTTLESSKSILIIASAQNTIKQYAEEIKKII